MENSETLVLKPTRLDDLRQPGLRVRRPFVVLLTRRGETFRAMVSNPLVQAAGGSVDGALEDLRTKIAKLYRTLVGKGEGRTPEESEDLEALNLFLELDHGGDGSASSSP